jgi:hypothetical protein
LKPADADWMRAPADPVAAHHVNAVSAPAGGMVSAQQLQRLGACGSNPRKPGPNLDEQDRDS